MKSPKVSIIIPVYNAASTIKKCVSSILGQTFKDFELILINDGSSDSSLSKIQKFMFDSRVRVIDKQNEGASQTRNRGIREAKGKYLLFIDSDDYIDKDYVESLYKEIEQSNFDMIISGIRMVDSSGKELNQFRLNDSPWSKYMITSPCTRIIRRKFVLKNNLFFIDYTMEDIHFNAVFFSRTDRVKVIPYIGYNYLMNPESTTHTLHKGITKEVDILHIISSIHSQVNPTDLVKYFYRKVYIYYLLKSGRYSTPEVFLNEYKRIRDYIKDNQLDSTIQLFDKRIREEKFFTKFIISTFGVLEKNNLISLFAKCYCIKK
ncbi:glycosyltransferase family 2 protein [Streptococcus suis]|nr:glycosyltransferase family 2 protein [Streptococcus suis]